MNTKLVTVKYAAGTYSGEKSVNAVDAEEAIAKVRSWVRQQMVSPMFADSYEVVREIELS